MANEIKSAEQTNVADVGTVQSTDAGTSSGQIENSASIEQGNNQEGVNNKGTGAEAPQDDATNAKFAEMRRGYERQLNDARKNAEKALSDAVKAKEVEMVKSLYKTNQWTGEPIEDEYDVEEFLAMKALSESGQDPMTAYHNQIKANKRNAAQAAKEKADSAAQKQTRAQAGLQKFKEEYPDVNVQELLADKDFLKFGMEALETVTLAKVYEAYLPIKEERARLKVEAEKQAAMASNALVAVGSATNPAPSAESEFFTKEQVIKMSPEEVKKNYEKIRASQAKW